MAARMKKLVEDELARQAEREEEARLAEEALENARIAEVSRIAFENTIYGQRQKAEAEAEAAKLAAQQRFTEEIA